MLHENRDEGDSVYNGSSIAVIWLWPMSETRECRKNFCAIHEALAKLYKSTKFPMVSWLNNSIKIMLPWLIGSKMPGARVEVLLAPDADVQKDGWNSWIHPCFCNVMSFNYSSVQKKLEDCEPWNWGAKTCSFSFYFGSTPNPVRLEIWRLCVSVGPVFW